MMAIENIIKRLDNLIEIGNKVLATRKSYGSHVIAEDYVDELLFQQWRTSSLALLNALPPQYVYRGEFERQCACNTISHAKAGVAILKAAKEDTEGGYLQNVETLVSANLFADFLDMAEHLLENSYKDPAASLIGAVLENGLRRICGNNGLVIKSDDNIGSLNQKLADNNIYNRLQQREIEVWNKLRDYADHGHFIEYDTEKVKAMLQGVRQFLGNLLK